MKLRNTVLPLLALASAAVSTCAVAKSEEDGPVVLDDRTLVLNTEVNEDSVGKLIKQIFSSSDKTMTMYIDSPGGSIDSGNKLITAMGSSGKKFNCVAGQIASMASAIFEVGCTTRLVTDSSTIMFHQAAYGLPAQQSRRTRSLLGFIETIVDRLEKKQAARLQMPVEAFRAKLDNDWWLYSDQIMDAKAADRVSGVVCTPELVTKTHTEQRQIFIFNVTVEVSGCPLIGDKVVAQGVPGGQ